MHAISSEICRWAYDGRGNAVVRKISELEAAVDSLGGYKQGLYGEKWVSFTKVSCFATRQSNCAAGK